jgi:hypothetical protein
VDEEDHDEDMSMEDVVKELLGLCDKLSHEDNPAASRVVAPLAMGSFLQNAQRTATSSVQRPRILENDAIVEVMERVLMRLLHDDDADIRIRTGPVAAVFLRLVAPEHKQPNLFPARIREVVMMRSCERNPKFAWSTLIEPLNGFGMYIAIAKVVEYVLI